MDGGFTWQPKMDQESVNSIGAIAVSPAAPKLIWVGTGEANARNSMGVGRGVWRSRDGGETWTHVRLVERSTSNRSSHIQRIRTLHGWAQWVRPGAPASTQELETSPALPPCSPPMA